VKEPDEEEPETEAPASTAAPATTVQAPRPAQTKPVRIHAFGPVTLYAQGHDAPIGTSLRSEVHEFLALLAAHPTGLLVSDIADKLRLAPGSEHNSLKNLRRAVRRALRGATGITGQEFILLQGELHKLHPDLIESDLADFTTGLSKAFAATDLSLAAAEEALRHYRAPFAHGSDYLWATPVREDHATRAIDAAIRLARHTERPGASDRERDTVLPLLEHLCALHPERETLAQHAIRLYRTAGRQDAAHHAFDRLRRALADLDMEPDQVTKALIAPRSVVGARR
jgi:DNA-binding SARP family transcriptional activator